MPKYSYEGPGYGLGIAGRQLVRGIPTDLEGRAAEAAARHPDVVLVHDAGGDGGGATSGSLDAYRALKARAKELGLPATGKAADLAEAIATEEARLEGESGGGAG